MGVVVIALRERSMEGPPSQLWLARALISILLALLLAYLALSRGTELGGVVLFALWPLAILGLALKDTRTPFLYTLVQAVLVVASALTASALFKAGLIPVAWLAVAIALGQSVANIVQFSLAVMLLRRKIGPLGLGGAARAVVRFLLAAVPSAAVGVTFFFLTGGVTGWTTTNGFLGFLGAALIGGTTLVVYAAILAAFRTPELATAGRALRRFLPGR
jgi:putative peptidoglycan lipid II flippase